MGIFSWFRRKDGPAAGTGPAGDTIDPGLMYCPQCHGEYRAGFVRCAACGVDLVSGARRQAQQGGNRRSAGPFLEITAEDNLMSLRRGQLKDIKDLKKLLAAEGIAAIIGGEEASCRTG